MDAAPLARVGNRCLPRAAVPRTMTTEGEHVSQPLTIYSTPWCGFCHRLMRQLDRAGVEYTSVDIERDPVAADLVMQLNGGNQTVPTVVFPDGSVLTNPGIGEVTSRLALS
jgi:mycoredoxin